MKKRINNAIDLWKILTEGSNFDEKYYDKDTAIYLKKKLGLPMEKSVLDGLKKTNIEIEEFIKVFFESITDFSAMMVDLLNMFELVAAKQTDKNLDIEFDFDKGKLPITVNLAEFRAYTIELKKNISQYRIPDLNNKQLWELLDIIENNANNINYDFNNYDSNFNINDLNFNANSSLYITFLVWKTVFKKYIDKLECNDINDFKKLKECLDKLRSKNYFLIDDNISKNDIIGWIKQMIILLKFLSDNENKELILKIEEDLSNFFKSIPTKNISFNKQIESIKEFLKLPFWNKRYELYSIWIFSLIIKALRKYPLIIHTINNKLIFPFKETHLATLVCIKGNILIFSEKKTPLNNPIGKSRKKYIQPDYSFFLEPITAESSSILEIECKQYKKPSTDNFARALIDYSNGRINADVVLVNYSKVNVGRVFKKIDELSKNNSVNNNKNRCRIIGELKPCNNSSKKIFMKEVEKKVSKYYCINLFLCCKSIGTFRLFKEHSKYLYELHPYPYYYY